MQTTEDSRAPQGGATVDAPPAAASGDGQAWGDGPLGKRVHRLEDAALLRGEGRYADDMPVPRGTLHAFVIRSPEAHAEIVSIDAAPALARPGVRAVVTGEDIRRISDPFLVALKQPIDQWSLAVGRVRHVGEPVAVVVAANRYEAEDAADLVRITYRRLPVVVDCEQAAQPDAPVLHEKAGTNLVSDRTFVYGDPDAQFAAAARTVATRIDYPRNSFTPMECFVVVARHRPADDSYDVLANFQGPFSAHPVMARALRVPGTRLRLRTPSDSGGSFGIKLSVFPYVVLMGLVSRLAGAPVKWVEDRLEHLESASSGPNRTSHIEAALDGEGRILALRMDNLEDYGAYLRAPMPGPLYRMQGSLTGAYDIRHLAVRQKVVLTNKMPSALIRGFGGPQLYLALERLMQRIAVEMDLDPLEVIRRNLIPAGSFPYQTCSGGLYDSGNYQKAIDIATGDGRLEALRARRDERRAAGKHYGIGFAAVVEPGQSNMGYLSTLVPVAKREAAGPKNGAVSVATVGVDPLGAVSVTADVTAQGQGHATALAQIVAQQLGLRPGQITVNLEIDTQKDQWSIAAGSYSSRFSSGTAVAAYRAAVRIRERVKRLAAKALNTLPEDLELVDGKVRSRQNPDNAIAFTRAAGMAHWSPILVPESDSAGLSETELWSPPQLTPPTSGDAINTSLTYGFLFDICGVEIDPDTLQVKVDRYISMHDAGRLLNPMLAEGQIRGGFVQGLSTALYEEFAYDDNGAFLTGTFAEYLVPTAMEVPELEILHIETPSPFTPLGAKGLAEGNCMSTPVCIANAVADALSLEHVPLPVTPDRLHRLLAGEEPAAPAGTAIPAPAPAGSGRAMQGRGSFEVGAPPETVWAALLDPESLRAVIPGCHSVEEVAPQHFVAEVTLGVGPIKGRFTADVRLTDMVTARSCTLSGTLAGPLGNSGGRGEVELAATDSGCRVDYRYEVFVGGKVASVGGRMLDRAADIIIGSFFERLAGHLAPGRPAAGTGFRGWWARLLGRLRGGRQ